MRGWLPGAVGIPAVHDGDDLHNDAAVVDQADDAVLAAPGQAGAIGAGTGRDGSHTRRTRAAVAGERSEPPLMIVKKVLTSR
jgi:hypothetical protein